MSLCIPYVPLYTLYNSAMFSDGGIKKQITIWTNGHTYASICTYMPLYASIYTLYIPLYTVFSDGGITRSESGWDG